MDSKGNILGGGGGMPSGCGWTILIIVGIIVICVIAGMIMEGC